MTYPLQRKRKPQTLLTDEEYDVQNALHEYTDDPDEVDFHDFVPTTVLYQVYRDYAAHFATDPYAPPTLTIRQFGAALLRVFPNLDEIDPQTKKNANRVQRRVNGKRVWGYQNFKGPLSIRR